MSTSIDSLQEKELKAEGLSSAEIEAALTEIAKSVAQLSMVITNLDNKVTSLEKDAVDFRTLSQKNMESVTADIRTLSQKNMEGVRTGPAVERRPKATYTIRKPVASGSVTQLKWDEAVRLADQSKPQGEIMLTVHSITSIRRYISSMRTSTLTCFSTDFGGIKCSPHSGSIIFI